MNETMTRNLLELTLGSATKDKQTTTLQTGVIDPPMPEGMRYRVARPIHDTRGHLIEIFDTRWDFHDEPYPQSYLSTLRPGVVKGWALHKLHEDRYFVVAGELELVTFDPRPESSTYGLLSRVMLTADQPRIINIPRFVWHADHNVGSVDAVIINLPTAPFDHANPDKYRLPIDTPLIPHRFEGATGGW
jgi:dTDP-4-dehydrorhamnose 3,5-epimerase